MEIQYKSYQPKNNYMFRIQELYKYQYLLQEITKELNSLVKNNDELEKLTTNVSFNKSQSNRILKAVIEKTAKTKPLYLFNLIAARKILLERIPILESLPVPQNSNEGYSNNGRYYNEHNNHLTRIKPKPNPKPMTEQQKLKFQRKGAEKKRNKSNRETNLEINTYPNNKKKTNNFFTLQKKKDFEQKQWENNLEFIYNSEPNSESNIRGNGNNRMLSSIRSGLDLISLGMNANNNEFNDRNLPNSGNNSSASNLSNSKNNSIASNSSNSGPKNLKKSQASSSKFFSNEESNSGYLSNNTFLANRHKRTERHKSKHNMLDFKK
jgi:hypothetical protein